MSDDKEPFSHGRSRVSFEHGRSRCRPIETKIVRRQIETKVVRRPFASHVTKRSLSRVPEGPVTIVGVQWRRGNLLLVLTSRAGRHVVPYEDYHSISS